MDYGLFIILKNTNQIEVSLMNPGEEVFMTYQWFPQNYPQIIKFDKDDRKWHDHILSYTDIEAKDCSAETEEAHNPISKSVESSVAISSDDLFGNSYAGFTGCLNERISILAQTDSCTLPWHWKLIENATKEDFRICPPERFFDLTNDDIYKALITGGLSEGRHTTSHTNS